MMKDHNTSQIFFCFSWTSSLLSIAQIPILDNHRKSKKTASATYMISWS